MAYIIKDTADFNVKIRWAGNRMILINFVSLWCPNCRNVGPLFDEMIKDYVTKVIVLKVTLEECPDVAEQFGITETPTYVFVYNSLVVESFCRGGVEKIKSVFDRYFK